MNEELQEVLKRAKRKFEKNVYSLIRGEEGIAMHTRKVKTPSGRLERAKRACRNYVDFLDARIEAAGREKKKPKPKKKKERSRTVSYTDNGIRGDK